MMEGAMKTASNCEKKKHFVLIHGANHGAWCWYKVATLLRSNGHNVTTLDMGASGMNPKQASQVCSFSDYYEPLMEFLETVPATEKVILVGHSLGGGPTSVAMERFPHKILVAVFVTANVLSQTLNQADIFSEFNRRTGSMMDSQYFYGNGPTKSPTAVQIGPEFMATRMYELSPPEDMTLALSLVRPQPLFSDAALLARQTEVTNARNGRVPKIFIIAKNDKLITEDFQNWTIQRSLPFDDVREIEGSDHMVMFSQPLKLASHLLQIADKY